MVVQQHSRKLLKMGILMPETCWVSKKKNKNSKWHLVGFLFFSYHKMHGPINIWLNFLWFNLMCLKLCLMSFIRTTINSPFFRQLTPKSPCYSMHGITYCWKCISLLYFVIYLFTIFTNLEDFSFSQILTFRGPCIVIYSYNKTNEMH